jgi:hypothetical protein
MLSRVGAPSLEEHIKCADELLQAVLNAWALNATTGHAAEFTAEFRVLAEKAFAYQTANRVADSQRLAKAIVEQVGRKDGADYSQFDALVNHALADEGLARESFAREYKDYSEKEECAILDSRAWPSYLADGPVASADFMDTVEDLPTPERRRQR